jgi:hypothetical protein
MHTDYLSMFGECLIQLRDEKAPLQTIANDLAKRRLLHEGVRIKSRAFLNALDGSDIDENFKQFLQESACLVGDGMNARCGGISDSIMVHFWVSEAQKSHIALNDSERAARREREHLGEDVMATTLGIDSQWSRICEVLARAKSSSLK